MSIENQRDQRPIDEVAEESYSCLGKSYVFIKKTKIKTWQSVFVLALLTGIAIASIFLISVDWQTSSFAATDCSPCFKGICDGKCNLSKEGPDCPDCQVPTTAVCGNGIIETGEVCDGTNLDGQTCQSLGYVDGSLSCHECNFNTYSCSSSDTCGDGYCAGGEETCNNCPDDCFGEITTICGDNMCMLGEDCNNCPEDCASGTMTAPSSCDNCFKGVCDGRCNSSKEGVNCSDCAQEANYCCGESNFYDSTYCGLMAGSSGIQVSCCGDGVCEGQETNINCETDCPFVGSVEFSFEELNWEGSNNCEAMGVNRKGQIIGTDYNSSFIYYNGVFDNMERFSDKSVIFYGINNFSKIAGSFRYNLSETEEGFIYEDGDSTFPKIYGMLQLIPIIPVHHLFESCKVIGT